MANDNRKNPNPNQSKPDQRDGMLDPSQKEEQGGNQQVNRDRDTKDRGKMGEQQGTDRQQQSGAEQSPDPSKGELGNEIDDEDDDLEDEDASAEDENKITQRQPAQQQRGRSDSSK